MCQTISKICEISYEYNECINYVCFTKSYFIYWVFYKLRVIRYNRESRTRLQKLKVYGFMGQMISNIGEISHEYIY